ncbi:FkbM family methyltransferase [Tamlana sp. s12]|uniref:FkbM family methyltransferase n=1 Tax=Tamlana sp. s12 TaxID=1630406 RepID=UPI0007FD2918|nr:FkbM family methyltransferase [Tamlana sp. s12]OBQ55380.1 hypothetical protein VQ01_07855 [Tamlana sp. s12]QQY80940.1 FkbM family methyltransferase [Tamlana sp. s12]
MLSINTRYSLAKIICRLLPPIFSQKIRDILISIEEGENLGVEFKTKSFTGSFFYGNTSDFHAFKYSVHSYFDWRNIIISNEVLKLYPGDIIEVGANIGTETISFADIAKKCNKQVYAYEPLPVNFKTLEKNKNKNQLQNLEIFEILVSDEPGKGKLKIPNKKNSGSGYIEKNTKEGTLECKVITLDQFLSDKIISFLCIDVEGFEFQVISGGAKLIRDHRPIIVTEVNQNYLRNRGRVDLEVFYQYFRNLDYNCYYVTKTGIKQVDISMFKNRNNKNWVCIPKEKENLNFKIKKSLFFNAFNPFFCINHF